MPAPRRSTPRNQNANVPSVLTASRTRINNESTTPPAGGVIDDEAAGSMVSLMPPKHAHVPEVPIDGNLTFEGIMFIFSVMCLCLQYINLYKTVWWLPHSHSNYALNFYLIDPYLAGLLVVMMSRRLVCCFCQEVQGAKSRRHCMYWLVQLAKLIVFVSSLGAFVFTAYHVVLRHSLLYSLFLCYPLVTYVILFGVDIKPLFSKTIILSNPASSTEKGTPKHNRSPDVVPVHCCSMSSETVREEVEILKTDFNNRIKQVLFNSMLCAYYMGFVPLCFAQNTLYYDAWWVGQHVCLVWISTFVLFMVHFLPTRYIDVLHRCALHLGKWIKVEGRHAHVPYNAWSELQVWQRGALVKHVRGLFKAEGINNSAEPGNGMHTKFYFMFHRPLRVTNWLLLITWALILYQFLILVQATEWSHIIALAFLLFANYYVLFKLMRDRFVLCKAYKEEQFS